MATYNYRSVRTGTVRQFRLPLDNAYLSEGSSRPKGATADVAQGSQNGGKAAN